MKNPLSNKQSRFSRVALIAVLAALLVSACGPVHLDPKWSDIGAIADGSIITLAFGDRLTLVDPTDGRPIELVDAEGTVRLDDQGNPRLWELLSPDGQQTRFYATPAMADEDTLVVASYDSRVFEVDVPVARVDGPIAQLGQQIVASPVIDGDMVYVGLSDKDVVALHRADLTEVWRFPTGHGVWAEPVVVDDTVYVASMDHHLYALDKETGELIWDADLGGALTSAPVYEDGHLYIGGFARKIFDVSAETGEILAEYPTAEWVWGQVALVDDILYAADMAGRVYALDTADGLTEEWAVAPATRSIAHRPLVTEDFVIVGSRDHNVYWLDRESGAVVDTKAVAGEVLTAPILIEPSESVGLAEPLVVVGTSATQELLVAFTLERGQRLWVYGR